MSRLSLRKQFECPLTAAIAVDSLQTVLCQERERCLSHLRYSFLQCSWRSTISICGCGTSDMATVIPTDPQDWDYLNNRPSPRPIRVRDVRVTPGQSVG